MSPEVARLRSPARIRTGRLVREDRK